MSNIDRLQDRLTNILKEKLSALRHKLEELSDELIEQLDLMREITPLIAEQILTCCHSAEETIATLSRLQERVNSSSLDSLKNEVQNCASVLADIVRHAPRVPYKDL